MVKYTGSICYLLKAYTYLQFTYVNILFTVYILLIYRTNSEKYRTIEQKVEFLLQKNLSFKTLVKMCIRDSM